MLKKLNNVIYEYTDKRLMILDYHINKITYSKNKINLVLTNGVKAIFLDVDKSTYIDNGNSRGIILTAKNYDKLIDIIINLESDLNDIN